MKEPGDVLGLGPVVFVVLVVIVVVISGLCYSFPRSLIVAISF